MTIARGFWFSLALLWVLIGQRADAAATAAMRVFQHADGQRYYALSLSADLPVTTSEPRDVVLLFDTSASQTGMYRDTALAALDACLAALSPHDRVKLVAVDLEPRPLQPQFAAPQGSETQRAVEMLRKDPPLGATNLPLALNRAVELFDADRPGNRVLIYIGDGMSMAQFVGKETLGKVVDQLRKNRVAVSSYAIGPARDNQLLAVLANQTGGNLYVDEEMTWADEATEITVDRATAENIRRGGKIGRQLAEWVRSPVMWVTIEAPSQLATLLPAQCPPMRGDRDAILVGQLADGASGSLTVDAAVSDGKQTSKLHWTVSISEPQPTYSYLAELVSLAQRDGGLTLPTLGTPGLDETGRMLLARVEALTDLAQQAVSTGDLTGAEQLSDAILVRDPGNLEAESVKRVIKKRRIPVKPMAHQQPAAGGELQLVRPAQLTRPAEIVPGDEVVVAAPPVDGPAPGTVEDGRFLEEVERQNRVFAQMLQKEVENVIRQARDTMAAEPDQATQQLKLALQNVERAPELIADVRAQLVDRLQSALREVARAAAIKDDLDREREEELAAAREMRLLSDRLQQRMEREEQLMDRFNALMDEGRYEEAIEVAGIVEEVDPNGVVPVVAQVWSNLKRNYELQQVTREARWRGFWDTMYQVELSSVPFPDDPPIVYPPAPFWEELTNRRKKYASVDLKTQGGAEEKINTALTSPLPVQGLEFLQTPLEEIIQTLRDEYEIEIQVDRPALEDLGIDETQPIDVNLHNISLRSALRLMLKELELTYVIADEVLLITTQEEADTRLSVRVYPVADLVLPIITPPPGGGGLGGQSGGFGGGQSGGFGGGGGGLGGGGGFGGGGGGFGGGGGQFSIPDDAATQGGADTQQDLTLTKAKREAKPATARPAPAPVITNEKPSRAAAEAAPAIKIDESVDPDKFWSDYFAQGMRDHAQVRQAVRDLMRDGRYDHAIALVNNALRYGQPQPWMYESLGISMQLSGRPKAEIERAVMSAIDFSTSPEEMLLVARYLSGLGLDRRAVRVYQQVVAADPLLHEAYALALRAAQRAEDLDGIRFATVGILGQAWPVQQMEIENVARRVAKATLAQLQEAGRTEEYEAYRNELNQSLARDCVIRVSWTGDADIDLAVEEPAGTVCSQLQPRTTSGGVSLGDAFAGRGATSEDGLSEVYVCPRGFGGTYRAQIRRIWGDVPADKVTVDVYLNAGSEGFQHERQQVALENGEAMVMFELPQGRRVEPLAEQQLARAVERRQQLGKAVMAQQFANNQQLNSLSDPSIIPNRPGFELARRALFGRGAVGFQPVITVLPKGTNFFATGVISADRRYVRITSVPFFSQIGDVTTFTFAGASRNTTGNGTGNGTGDGNGNGDAAGAAAGGGAGGIGLPGAGF